MSEPTEPAKAPVPPVDPLEEPEVELSIGDYFGGYAIIFIGVVGLALCLVLLMKVLR